MMLSMTLVLLFLICPFQSVKSETFPDDFLFGVATSAYQIEGGWNASGKGVNIWDDFTHNHPDKIVDGSNGDIASDSYHKYEDDVALLKKLGAQFYRFSLSWSRILPNGYSNHVNPDGIRYYNAIIDKLVENNIIPMVTLFHWDLPLPLQRIGGWSNPVLADIFVDYAKVAFTYFGDRVPYWITFNTDCRGYSGDVIPPRMNQSGIGDYLCGHTTIRAHAKTYKLYQKNFKKLQNGEVGIVSAGVIWYEAKSQTKADLVAAERVRQFELGYYIHPLVIGDYPHVVKERVAYRSDKEGYSKSRLPNFTSDEKRLNKDAYDFIAINIYTTNLVSDIAEPSFASTNYANDMKAALSVNPHWNETTVSWLKIVPDSIRKILKWFKRQYNNPKMVISENGCAGDEDLEDHTRVYYHQEYLKELLKAIREDEVNVVGYAAWSLLDNFEWNDGYTQTFGLHHVNFTDPNRTRTERLSAKMYKKVIEERQLQDEFLNWNEIKIFF